MNKFDPKYKKNVDYNKYTTLSEWWKMVADNFEDLVSGVSGWTQSLLTFLDNTFQKSEAGKGLSTNDYTTAEKSKLGGIEAGAEKNAVDNVKLGGTSVVVDGVANIPLDSTPTSGSNNPVKSGGVYAALQNKAEKLDYITDDIDTIFTDGIYKLETGMHDPTSGVDYDETSYLLVNEKKNNSGCNQTLVSPHGIKHRVWDLWDRWGEWFDFEFEIRGKVDKDGTKVLSDNNYSNGDKSKVANIIPYWKPNTAYSEDDVVKYFNANAFWILKCTENHTSDADVPPYVPGSPWQTCIINYAGTANYAINAGTAEVAYKDVDGNEIKYVYAKSSDVYNKADKTTFQNIMGSTATIDYIANNTVYEFMATPMTSITLAMTQDFWDTQGSIFGYNFISGQTPTIITFSTPVVIKYKGDDCDNGAFTPVSNKAYEVIVYVAVHGQLWGDVASRDYEVTA